MSVPRGEIRLPQYNVPLVAGRELGQDPEFKELVEGFQNDPHRKVRQAVEDRFPLSPRVDQLLLTQQRKVLGNGRLVQFREGDDLVDGAFAFHQTAQYFQPVLICQDTKEIPGR